MRKNQDFEAIEVHMALNSNKEFAPMTGKRHGWLTVYLSMDTMRLVIRYDCFSLPIKSYERNFDVSYIFKRVKFIKAAHLESKSFLVMFEDIVDTLLGEMRIHNDTNITLSK